MAKKVLRKNRTASESETDNIVSQPKFEALNEMLRFDCLKFNQKLFCSKIGLVEKCWHRRQPFKRH